MYKAVCVAVLVALSGCAPIGPNVGMANPASTYCVDMGGSVSIQNTGSGDIGICTLPDGSTIEEWELFRRDNP